MAAIEIITKEDLMAFKAELLTELRSLIQPSLSEEKQWLKSSQVRDLLHISAGTLQNLRISGKLTYTKVGGIHYYKATDIQQLLNDGKVGR